MVFILFSFWPVQKFPPLDRILVVEWRQRAHQPLRPTTNIFIQQFKRIKYELFTNRHCWRLFFRFCINRLRWFPSYSLSLSIFMLLSSFCSPILLSISLIVIFNWNGTMKYIKFEMIKKEEHLNGNKQCNGEWLGECMMLSTDMNMYKMNGKNSNIKL